MSAKVISISSSQHFKTIVASSTYVIVDFYADWCGPCKVISPVFEQLAAQESKPGRLTFVKVDVDNQRDVASTYGISAMPTFLILKGTKVVETVRGANASALRTAVLSAAAEAARGPARQSVAFTGSGQTLGGGGAGGNTAKRTARAFPSTAGVNLGAILSGPAAFAQGNGFPQLVVRFLGLYLSTLFSVDPVKTAQDSPFAATKSNVRAR